MRAVKLFTLLAFVIALSACASDRHEQRDMTQAPNFVTMAASSDKFEIASSRLALHRSHNADVRRIAKRMISDHTLSSKKLTAVLAADGMAAPSPTMLHHHQRALEELRTTTDFNQDYLEAQEVAHHQGIWLFRTYTERGDNMDLRDFAAKTLPTLYKHLHMIEKAEGKDTDMSYENSYEKRDMDNRSSRQND